MAVPPPLGTRVGGGGPDGQVRQVGNGGAVAAEEDGDAVVVRATRGRKKGVGQPILVIHATLKV
jgi:hypothetical protein